MPAGAKREEPAYIFVSGTPTDMSAGLVERGEADDEGGEEEGQGFVAQCSPQTSTP